MKVKCKVLRVDRLNSTSVGLLLQPLVENCPSFPFVVFNSEYDYYAGDCIELSLQEIIEMLNVCFWNCLYLVKVDLDGMR